MMFFGQMQFDWMINNESSLNIKIIDHKLNKLMKKQEDSFEECKRQLEESLGASSLMPPTKPMNPFMRFFLQRSSEERSKGRKDWNTITKEITQEWKVLSESRKEFYQKIYQVRLRQKNSLLDQYNQLANKRRPILPYARFVKKRYAQYAKEHKNSNSAQINKLISIDWRKISAKDKKKFTDQYKREINDEGLKIDNTDRIEEYNQRLKRYHEQLHEEKEKILRKYGLTKENRARIRRQEIQEKRRQKRAERFLERQQRRFEIQQQRRKVRLANREKLQQYKEEQKRQRAEERQRQRQRLRAQKQQRKTSEAERRRQLRQEEKLKKANKDPTVKQEAKQTKKGGVKSKSKPKAEAKKVAAKTKKIKKLATKAKTIKSATPKEPAQEKKVEVKSKQKAKAKPKPKGKGKNRRAKK